MPEFNTLKELFFYVWETREHVSELTGEPLLPECNDRWHWQFLHVLNKNTYPEYKFDPDNILLGLPEEHEKQEDYQVFRDKLEEMKAKANNNKTLIRA